MTKSNFIYFTCKLSTFLQKSSSDIIITNILRHVDTAKVGVQVTNIFTKWLKFKEIFGKKAY